MSDLLSVGLAFELSNRGCEYLVFGFADDGVHVMEVGCAHLLCGLALLPCEDCGFPVSGQVIVLGEVRGGPVYLDS